MRRRHFIKLSSFATALSMTPWLQGCTTDPKEVLATPQTLGTFCSREELTAIGKTYCAQNPNECDKSSLERLILEDNGKAFPLTDASELSRFLNHKINAEFNHNDLAIIDGWVLSRTEARQIALYSRRS